MNLDAEQVGEGGMGSKIGAESVACEELATVWEGVSTAFEAHAGFIGKFDYFTST